MPFKPCLDCGTPFFLRTGPRLHCVRCSIARRVALRPARAAAANAIRAGRLIPQPCEICGAAKVDGHHDDYSRPLDVRWLCRTHHRQFHEAARRAAIARAA